MTLNCTTCSKQVTPKQLSIKCSSTCLGTFHAKCVNINADELKSLISIKGCFWKCSKCITITPNINFSMEQKDLIKSA